MKCAMIFWDPMCVCFCSMSGGNHGQNTYLRLTSWALGTAEGWAGGPDFPTCPGLNCVPIHFVFACGPLVGRHCHKLYRISGDYRMLPCLPLHHAAERRLAAHGHFCLTAERRDGN